MNIIIALMGIGIIFALQDMVYSKYWKRGLSADVRFAATTGVEGDTLELTETIVNQKILPLPMVKYKFEVDKSFVFEDTQNTNVTDKCYKNDIFSIMMYQKIVRHVPFVCKKRGYFQIEGLDIVSSNLFLSSTLVDKKDCVTALTIYPSFVDTNRINVLYRQLLGTIITKQYTMEDPFEFRGIRDYTFTDPMKAVNWSASAKTGELKVNSHNYTSKQEVCILLNLEDEGVLSYEALKEESMRIAGSLSAMFIDSGIPVSMITNGRDILTDKIQNVEAGSGRQHVNCILDALARIDLEKEIIPFVPYAMKYTEHMASNVLYILISTYRHEDIVSFFNGISDSSEGSVFITPVHKDMERELSLNDTNAHVVWEVAYEAQ